MRKSVQKLKNAGINARAAVCSAILTAQTAVTSGIVAAGDSNDTVDGIREDLKGGSLVQEILDVVINIFVLMGAFFVVSGIYKLVMAYKDNQPEQQNAAIRDIVIGAVLIVFRVFLWKPISKAIFSNVG